MLKVLVTELVNGRKLPPTRRTRSSQRVSRAGHARLPAAAAPNPDYANHPRGGFFLRTGLERCGRCRRNRGGTSRGGRGSRLGGRRACDLILVGLGGPGKRRGKVATDEQQDQASDREDHRPGSVNSRPSALTASGQPNFSMALPLPVDRRAHRGLADGLAAAAGSWGTCGRGSAVVDPTGDSDADRAVRAIGSRIRGMHRSTFRWRLENATGGSVPRRRGGPKSGRNSKRAVQRWAISS